jgi:hypothetical protein
VNIKKIFALSLLLFVFYYPCFAEDHIIVKWMKKIGDGENLKEPAWPYDTLTPEISNYIRKLPPIDLESFIACMTILDRHHSYGYGRGFPEFHIKDVPYEVVAKVFRRRKPLLNLYPHDKSAYPGGTPRIFYRMGGASADYLSIFQLCILEKLVEGKDLRFEKEITLFLDYLSAPIDSNINAWKIRDDLKDARLSSTDYMQIQLRNTALEYINLFRNKRGQSPVDLYETRHNLFTKYHFGQNCHYYDIKNWPEYEKKPPTEEEMQRFHEISRQWREESERRWKKKSVSRDEAETAVHRLQQALEQPNISSQEREYLEKRINHVKNKKYE